MLAQPSDAVARSVSGARARHDPTGHADAATDGRVGPNAVIQLGNAATDAAGAFVAADIFARAGLSHCLAAPPAGLVPEGEVHRLFAALRTAVGDASADRILADAGTRTGAYILANRIPRQAQRVIGVLPRGLAVRVLSAAIVRHAWTFAGSGHVTFAARPEPHLVIAANPLATPGCPWHVAVLETLYRALVSPRVAIAHQACCGRGGDCCRFAIVVRGH